MRRAPLLSLFAAVAFLTACGADGRSSVEGAPPEKAASKIIHGTLDTGTTHDAVVYIEFVVDAAKGLGGACSGTLIAPNVVVTARHCVSALNESVRPAAFGADYDATTMGVYLQTEPRGSPDAGVARIVHTDAGTLDNNDFALLVLKRSIGKAIAPVRLAAPPAVDEDTYVVGYGITELDTGATPTAIHQRYWRDNVKIQYLGPIPTYGIGDREIVMGEATCEGDSGGPVMDHTTGALLALTSRGGNGTAPVSGRPSSTCTGSSTYNIFTRVDGFAALINSTLATLGETPWEEGTPAPSGPPTKPPPTPGSLGAACAAPKECSSGICVAVNGVEVCSQACSDTKPCPGGYDCVSNYCIASAPAPVDDAGPPPDDAGTPPADDAGAGTPPATTGQPESNTSSTGSKCSIAQAPSSRDGSGTAARASLVGAAIAASIAFARRRRRG